MLVSCPTWVLITDVPPVPAVTASTPVLVTSPLPVVAIVPVPVELVESATSVFAVIVPTILMLLPESTVTLKEPESSLFVFN